MTHAQAMEAYKTGTPVKANRDIFIKGNPLRVPKGSEGTITGYDDTRFYVVFSGRGGWCLPSELQRTKWL